MKVTPFPKKKKKKKKKTKHLKLLFIELKMFNKTS